MIIQGVTLSNTIVYDSSFNSNGALLYLDAGQTASYPGSGTTWTDLSGNGRNGTLISGPTYSRADGGSIVFDGTNDYVQCSGSLTVTEATFLVWMRRNGPQDDYDGILYSRSITAATGISFFGITNKISYTWNNAVNTYSWDSGLTIPDLTWCMVAVSVTSTTATAYLCQSSGITSATNTVSHTSTTLDAIRIGQDSLASRYFNGRIATAVIYNRALSADEITQNFNTLRGRVDTAVTTNLVAYYNPDLTTSYPGSGTTLFDISGNDLNGTMSNITYTDPYFTYNGTSSQVNIADNALLEPGAGDWTMEAWFNTTAFKTGSAGTILGKFDPGGASQDVSYSIRTNNTGIVYAQIGNGTTVVNSPNYQTVLSTWVQVVYVWKNVASNSLEAYINGVSIGSTAHSFSSILNTSTNLYIGSYNGGEYPQYFDGRIGITRLYNTALTAEQVLQNYNANRSVYGL
jgi:hypothetical protein